MQTLLYGPSTLGVRAGKADYFIYRLSINLSVFSPASPSRSTMYFRLWIRNLCEILQDNDFHLPWDPFMVRCGLQLYPLSVSHPHASLHLLSSRDCWNFLCSSISLLLEMYCPFLFLYSLMESQEVLKRNTCAPSRTGRKPHIFKSSHALLRISKLGRPCSKLSYFPFILSTDIYFFVTPCILWLMFLNSWSFSSE